MKFFTDNDFDTLVFFQVPKVLVLGERYVKMKTNALKLYMVLFDRLKLSIKNNWRDEHGRYYVRMSQDGAADLFGWSPTTFRSMKKELEKFELLMQVQEGQGKSNRLYLAKCVYDEKDVYKVNKSIDTEMEENEKNAQSIDIAQKNNFCSPAENTEKDKSCLSRRTKVDLLEEQKLTTSNNYFNKTKSNNNKELGNNLLTNKQDTIDNLILEYMKKGLSKEVCQLVLNEIEQNPDVKNFGGYFRTALENALHRSKVKHGLKDPSERLVAASKTNPVLYNWLEE